MTALSASSAGTWAQICKQNDYAPDTTIVSRGHTLGRLPCIGARVVFADQSLSQEDSLPKLSGRKAQFTWSRHRVRLLFLRVTRSCWTASLSPVKFAPQAASRTRRLQRSRAFGA